ncbi:34582_t:CDS:2, partial [Racocetra persica]
ENSELKIKVAKLSCDFEKIKSKGIITDSPEKLPISEKKTVSVSTEMENSNVTPEQIDLQTGVSQPDKEEAITPDSMPEIEQSLTQVQKAESSTTSLPQNIIDVDMAETLDFVEMKHKERGKKLRDQNSSLNSTSSEPFYENQNLESSIISQSISNSS